MIKTKDENYRDDACALKWDYLHLIDVEVDAWLVKFPNFGKIRLYSTENYSFPDRIEFDALLDVVETIDFPVNDVNWPIISKRMLRTLIEVGNFIYREIPIVMKDCQIISFKDGIPVKSSREDYSFIAIQLLEHIDAFDWDKSRYELNPISPSIVKTIKKLVLKKPENGFPPLFRLAAYPAQLFLSSDARYALERSKIRGLAFEDISKFKI